MDNIHYLEAQQKSHGFLNRIFWIAAQSDSSELAEFLDEIKVRDLKELFPDVAGQMYDIEDDSDDDFDCAESDIILEHLINSNYLGFIGELYVPVIGDVSFDSEGNPDGWSSSKGHCMIFTIYADRLDELFGLAHSTSQNEFDKMIFKIKDKIK